MPESLQSDLALVNKNIKVLALCPGFVNTKITESERNRPTYSSDNQTINPKLEPIMNAYQQIISNGISPKIVAEKLFQALNDEKFYIPTDSHQIIRSKIKTRMDRIIKDFRKWY